MKNLTSTQVPLSSRALPALRIRRKTEIILLFAAAAGIGSLLLGIFRSPERAWANVLLNNYYFLSLALAGIIWVAIQYVSNAGWGTAVRRIPESMTAFLPVGAVFMFPLYFGMHSLYEWTHESAVAGSALLQYKEIYLNVPFFFIRMVVFMVLWLWFTRAIIRNSQLQDSSGGLELFRKNVRLSAAFLFLFSLTFILASFDWIMSLEPEWFSTMFPVYTFSGLFLNGIAAITLIVILLRRAGLLPMVNENHLNDLGRLLFAFSVFWGYIWFSQYALIWYANISEEAAYFVRRTGEGWNYLFYLPMILNWLIPFTALVTRRAKRSERLLFRVCIVIMAGHWLDLYLMIMPVFEITPRFGLDEILSFAGYSALFTLVLLGRLKRIRLVPVKDPYLEESLTLHN